MNPHSITADFSLNETLYGKELSRADALARFLSIVSIASVRQLYRFELIRQKVVFGKAFNPRNLEKLVRKLLPGLEQQRTSDGQKIAFASDAFYPTLTVPSDIDIGPIFASARDVEFSVQEAEEAIYSQVHHYWSCQRDTKQKVYCTSAEIMAYPAIAFSEHAEYMISCAAITDYFLELFESNSPESIERIKTFSRVPIVYDKKVDGKLTHPYFGEAVVGPKGNRVHICIPIANWFSDLQNGRGEKLNVRNCLQKIHDDFASQELQYELYAPGRCSLRGFRKITEGNQ